jgi:hypothetical protein
MANPSNTKLYASVKEEAKRKFKRWPSAYGSAWLVKEYKKRGGKYTGSKSPRSSPKKSTSPQGVGRWMKEEWIQVVPYLKYGKKVACGARKDATKACRPLKRISSETPITISELVKLHGKKRVLELANHKIKDMDGRLYWKRGVFHKS